MKDFRLDLRLRNNRILRRIEELGYPNIGKFARAHPDVKRATIDNLVNLRQSPFSGKTGEWRPSVVQLAAVLCCEPAELFSEDLLREHRTNEARLEIDASEVVDLLSGARTLALPPDEAFDRVELPAVFDGLLETLGPQQSRIIRARFGLDGEEPLTLEAIGVIEGVGRERIRQIESRALRKLRHPSRANRLKPFAKRILDS